MSSIIKTPALLVSAINWSESSKIGTFITPNHGLVSLIIKGARKSKSKYSGLLQPFAESEIIYSEKASRELQILKEISIIHEFLGLRSNPLEFMKLDILAELYRKLIQPGEEMDIYYHHIIRVLTFLNEQENPLFNNAIVHLVTAFTKFSGYPVNYEGCARCGKTFSGSPIFLTQAEGQLICVSCHNQNQEHSLNIEPDIIHSIKLVNPFRNFQQTNQCLTNQQLFNLCDFFIHYLSYHAHRMLRLNSLQVIKELLS
ncbi:MAG: hypothetical protein Kow00108_08450 [Calditrichia bacterium]